MWKSQAYRQLQSQGVQCLQCKKQHPPNFIMISHDQNSHNSVKHCINCLRQNSKLLVNVNETYKQYFINLIQTLPIPNKQQVQYCLESIQKLKKLANNKIDSLRTQINQFEQDINNFIYQTTSLCQNYCTKMQIINNLNISNWLKYPPKFINQQKYLTNIKIKYYHSQAIYKYLQQQCIFNITTLQTIIQKDNKSFKKRIICNVPICSIICIKGINYFGTTDGRIILQDINYKLTIINAHESLIRSFAYDGQFMLYSGSDDFLIKAWDLHHKQPKLIGQFGIIQDKKSYHRDMVLLQNGKILASSRGQFDSFKIRLWELNSYTNIRTLDSHSSFIKGLVKTDDNYLISVSDDCTLKIWNHQQKICQRTFYHNYKINGLMINNTMKLISIIDSFNRLIVINLIELQIINGVYHKKKIICFTSNNQYIYINLSAQICVYKWNTQLITNINLNMNLLISNMVAFHDRLLLCQGSGNVMELPIPKI